MVPPGNELSGGTVPPDNELSGGTVPPDNHILYYTKFSPDGRQNRVGR